MWPEFARLPNDPDTRFPSPMRPENVIIPMVLAQKRTHKNRGNAEEEIL